MNDDNSNNKNNNKNKQKTARVIRWELNWCSGFMFKSF